MVERSKIARVSPQQVTVAVRGKVRLRVEGRGYGYVQVGRDRRWCWGKFDTCFWATVPEENVIVVSVLGLGGSARSTVDCAAFIDLQSPSAKQRLPLLRTSVVLPHVRSLQVRSFAAPRVVRISSTPTHAGDENQVEL